MQGLIDNGGAIQADGGRILLTAQAADMLSTSIINQTGLLRARTLSTGAEGEILLLGDMDRGVLNAAGMLDASAPSGGHGGFIETSAATVNTTTGLNVDASSASGQGGLWLVDPYDYTINATAAGNISSALNNGTSVTVTTQANSSSYGATASGSGDITVSSAITKSSGGSASLTLQADRNITVGAGITSTSGALDITLSAAHNASSNLGGVNVGANLNSNGGRILIGGAGGNQTTAESYGIGYALNTTLSDPAIKIGSNVSILSGGGDITINGRSAATNSGSYSGVKGGIYVLSGATVDTGGGNLFMSGISSTGDKVFGFGVEANSGTVTTFQTNTGSGVISVDAQNLINSLGALGLVNNGNQARVKFWAPSVAHMLFRINGDNKATTFTISPPCQAAYPNCGTMVIPGGNQSYTSAMYNVVSMAMNPIYIFTGSATRTYDGSTDATGVPLTSLGGPGGFSASDLGSLSFSTTSKNVGSYHSLVSDPSNPSSYSGGTYAVAYFNQGTYAVTPKAINSFSAGNKVYDGTTAANVTSADIITGDAVTVSATGGFASANVGNGITVYVSGVGITGADAGNYTVNAGGSISTTANITPAPLTITAANDSKTYNGLAYSGGQGVSYSGLVNGETSSVLSGSLSYSGSSQGATNAGSYAITPQGLSSSNYDITYADGTFTINPATLTWVANSASRTYGSTNPAFSGTVTGFVNGETLAGATSGSLSFSSSATTSSNVGSYAITGSGLSANHGNYVFVQDAGNSSALSVTPAALTITAANDSKTYNGLAYSGGQGVSYSGLVNGETSSVLSGSLSYSGSSQGATNAGSYAITPQGLSSSNYDITYANGTLTINPATLAVITGDLTGLVSKVYDATTTARLTPANYRLVGWVGSDGATVTKTTGTYDNANVGTGKTVTVALDSTDFSATGSTVLSNYVLPTSVSGTVGVITPATLTLTAQADSKTYNGSTSSTALPTVSGLQGNDSMTDLLQAFSNKNAGSEKTLSVIGYKLNDGNQGGNYNVVLVDSHGGEIQRANATVTGSAATLDYNAQTQSQTAASSSGFLSGDDIHITGTASGRNAGTYLSALSIGGDDASNYNVSITNANLVIVPGTLTLTADRATRAVGSPDPAFSGTVTGFVGDDSAGNALSGNLVFTTTAQPTSPEGSYALQGGGLTALNGNYVFRQADGNASALTLTAALPSVDMYLPRTSPVPNFPDNALPSLGSDRTGLNGGNLNYVPLRSGPGNAPDDGTNRNDIQSADAGGTSPRGRQARQGLAATAVPSANGPLDIFVMDDGINLTPATQPSTAD